MDTSIVQEQGIPAELTVTNSTDMNLQVIKSNTASVQLPELDFEIPHTTQRGVMSTVEGIAAHSVGQFERISKEERRRSRSYCSRRSLVHLWLSQLS